MDEPQGRKAANEAVFRDVNEQIEGLQQRFAITVGEPLALVCECDRIECFEQLEVPVDRYESVRSDSAAFVVASGHEDPSVEDVVDSGGGYLIVRKHAGEPRAVAEQTDPRR